MANLWPGPPGAMLSHQVQFLQPRSSCPTLPDRRPLLCRQQQHNTAPHPDGAALLFRGARLLQRGCQLGVAPVHRLGEWRRQAGQRKRRRHPAPRPRRSAHACGSRGGLKQRRMQAASRQRHTVGREPALELGTISLAPACGGAGALAVGQDNAWQMLRGKRGLRGAAPAARRPNRRAEAPTAAAHTCCRGTYALL